MKSFIDKSIEKYGLPEYKNYDKTCMIKSLSDANKYIKRYHKHAIVTENGAHQTQTKPELKKSGNIIKIKFYASVDDSYVGAVSKFISNNISSNCNIILDLRECDGGNLWYLVKSIIPIINNTTLCRFVQDKNSSNPWVNVINGKIKFGKFISDKLEFGGKIAVIVGNKTSSAEILVSMLISRPNTKVFGQRTGGYNTANQMIKYGKYTLHIPSTYIQHVSGRILCEYITPTITTSPIRSAISFIKN